MIKIHCPICQRPLEGSDPAAWPHFPFCSQRCRLIDLGRWLNEEYRLASNADDLPPFPAEETDGGADASS